MLHLISWVWFTRVPVEWVMTPLFAGNSRDPRSATRLKNHYKRLATDKQYRNCRATNQSPAVAGHHKCATNVLDATDNNKWV